MRTVISVILVAFGIIACSGGSSSDWDTGVFSDVLPALSQSEATCLETRPTPEEVAAIYDYFSSLEARWPLPDDLSWSEVLRENYRDRVALMEVFSPIWDRCVSPESDEDVALHMFEDIYGPARTETEACVRDAWQKLDVSETVIGQWAEWAGFESRWVAINASLEAIGGWPVGEGSCVTEVEEVERDVKRFAENFGSGRLTETEIDCARQIARDGGYLPWSMEQLTLGESGAEYIDESVFRCITPERFAEIELDHYVASWPFSLYGHRLDCVSDGLSDMWRGFSDVSSYPGHLGYSTVAHFFGTFIFATCLSNSQIAKMQEAYLSEHGATKEMRNYKLSSREVRCMREWANLGIEAYNEHGWASWVYELTPEQDAIWDARAEELEKQCPLEPGWLEDS